MSGTLPDLRQVLAEVGREHLYRSWLRRHERQLREEENHSQLLPLAYLEAVLVGKGRPLPKTVRLVFAVGLPSQWHSLTYWKHDPVIPPAFMLTSLHNGREWTLAHYCGAEEGS